MWGFGGCDRICLSRKNFYGGRATPVPAGPVQSRPVPSPVPPQSPVPRGGDIEKGLYHILVKTLKKLLSFFDISLYLLSRLRLGLCG